MYYKTSENHIIHTARKTTNT